MRKIIVLAIIVVLGLGFGFYLSTTSRADAWSPEKDVAGLTSGDQVTCAGVCGSACKDGKRTDVDHCPSLDDNDSHASSDSTCDDDHHASSDCACDGDRDTCTDDMKASCEHLKSCSDSHEES